jgi:hypothetical protein
LGGPLHDSDDVDCLQVFVIFLPFIVGQNSLVAFVGEFVDSSLVVRIGSKLGYRSGVFERDSVGHSLKESIEDRGGLCLAHDAILPRLGLATRAGGRFDSSTSSAVPQKRPAVTATAGGTSVRESSDTIGRTGF